MEQYILIDTLNQHPFELKNLSAEVQDNEELVRIAVKKNGLALQYASERLRNDSETVMIAVKKNGLALQYASDILKNDNSIIFQAVISDGNALEFVPLELRNDRNLILEASRNCNAELVPEQFLSDDEIAQNLLDHDYRAFAYLSDEFRKDMDLIIDVIQHNGDMLMYVPDDVLNNKENVLQLLTENAYVLNYIPDELKNDKEIALAAMSSCGSPWAYSVLPRELQSDADILRALVYNISSEDELDFCNFFGGYNIPDEVLADDDFIRCVAGIYECSEFELEPDEKLVLRMIELCVLNTDLVSDEILDNPVIQDALSEYMPLDIFDDEEDDL